jgi:hypothetical protein
MERVDELMISLTSMNYMKKKKKKRLLQILINPAQSLKYEDVTNISDKWYGIDTQQVKSTSDSSDGDESSVWDDENRAWKRVNLYIINL